MSDEKIGPLRDNFSEGGSCCKVDCAIVKYVHIKTCAANEAA